MTRGKIIFIKEESIYISTEFNGDMYPEGLGDVVIKAFPNIDTPEQYIEFLEQFNNEYFNYDICLYHKLSFREKGDTIPFDVRKNTSDYLYLINSRDVPFFVKDNSDGLREIPGKSLGIVKFRQCGGYISRNPCILTREEFVDIINRLRDSKDLVDAVNYPAHAVRSTYGRGLKREKP